MPDGFVQVAPDSTGARIRTRERTVGGNVVDEQYVITLTSDRVVSARAWLATPRIPSRVTAANASQNIFTLWNGGTNLVAIRRLTLEVDSGGALANISPVARLLRLTAAPTGGTTLAKGQQDTNETTSAGIVALHDAGATDGSSAAAVIAATANPTTHIWEQTVPRLHTAVGWVAPPLLNMLPDDASLTTEAPLILRPSQGVLVRVDAGPGAMATGATATTAGSFQFYVKCVLGEFTLP